MADVFSRASQNLAGVIPVDAAVLSFASSSGTPFGVGMLTQNVQINYQQQISRIYEIGTNNTYFVGGRTQGQIGMSRIIGPQAIQVAFYTQFGNMCNAQSNTINLSTGDGSCASNTFVGPKNSSTSTFSVKYCVITNIGITITAQDMVVNENLQLLFVSLEVSSR